MSPSASIVLPTRGRPGYLAVALASVSAQARAHGAEVLVVEDDVATTPTSELAQRHGARHISLGGRRGLNHARNAGLRAARADLVCFLDDDVRVWPGWLESLLAGVESSPGHDAFGGPIRPRLEGARLRTCGREPPPITALDLGNRDRDADFAWGANFALRRASLERAGWFDPALNYCGDEEDWQRRLRAAGGRVRYLAAAGVDHRRAGDDVRLRSLARAAYFRGRHARRYDAHKGVRPSLRRELRVLAGCIWHAGRHVCANGLVLTAMSAGRLHEAVAPARPAAPHIPAPTRPAPPGVLASAAPTPRQEVAAATPDFLSGESGTLSRRGLLRARALDLVADVVTAPRRILLRAAARRGPARRVLVLGVMRQRNAVRVEAIRRELHASRHLVDFHMIEGAPGAGKWANLNAALAERPVDGHDWLLLVDDDVSLPAGFLDTFLFACERFGLTLAQPAHAYASHAAWRVTRRRPGVVARETLFVEIGPVTGIAARAFEQLLPFPDLQMGWGLDFHWGAVAARRGWRAGVVDATPIHHESPVGAHYPYDAAVAEAEKFLSGRLRLTRAQAGRTVRRHVTWRS